MKGLYTLTALGGVTLGMTILGFNQYLHRQVKPTLEPFVYEESDFNQDRIPDRKISQMEKEQIQYGVRNPSGEIEYLTQDQIIQRARNDYQFSKEGLLEKYSVKGGGD